MSHATEQARSTRGDARAFADAFAAADDAFTFGPDAGESRTLDLSELGDVISLDRPVGLPAPDAARGVARTSSLEADDELLTLDELGEALRKPARQADDLDFDFGTSAHERARRRTAARLDASPSARRRTSGASTGTRHADDGRSGTAGHAPSRGADRPGSRARFARGEVPAGRDGLADASASAAELLAVPGRAGRFARASADAPDAAGTVSRRSGTPRDASGRLGAARSTPIELRPSDDVLADPGARRTVGIAGRPDAHAHAHAGAGARLREVQRDRAPHEAVVERFRANPDRIAMWAVLLGILLVLIAVSSGSAGAVALPLVAAL